MQVYLTDQAAVAALRSGAVAAFLTDAPTLAYFGAQLPCDLVLVAPTFGPSSLTLGLPLNSSLLAPLDSALLQVHGYRALFW